MALHELIIVLLGNVDSADVGQAGCEGVLGYHAFRTARVNNYQQHYQRYPKKQTFVILLTVKTPASEQSIPFINDSTKVVGG